MKEKMKKGLILFVAFIYLFNISGCKNKNKETTIEQDLSSYPVSSDYTLDYWVSLNSGVTATADTLNDTPWAKALKEATGINVNFIHPAVGKHDEQFSVLLASGNLPDIMEYEWYKYPGGYQKAMNDGVVVDLMPYMNNYMADFAAKLNDEKYNPYIKQAMTVDGNKFFGTVPLLDMRDVKLKSVYGPIFRKDWLDELNLDVPETVDEWTEVLTAFKEKKNVLKPFTFIYEYLRFYSILCGTWGVKQDYYPDNGIIKYGPMEDGYKQFLVQMNDWYKKGLLDKSIATVDASSRDEAFLSGKCGVTYGFMGGNLINWEKDLKKTESNAELIAGKHISLKKGEPCEIAATGNSYGRSVSCVITKDCKNPDLAARFLNYGYTDEGSLLYTFGILGESYEMKDNAPAYTDLIKNNPDYIMGQILPAYTKTYAGPMEIHTQYYKEYYGNEKQIDAIAKWGVSNGEKYDMPYINVSEVDANELARIQAKLDQYVDEMTMRFIVGSESLDKFDEYVDNLKKFGADKAIAMYQEAYDKLSK